MHSYNTRPHFGQLMPATVACVVHDNASLIREYLEWKGSYTQRASKAYAIWVKRFQEFVNKQPEALGIGDWTAFAQSISEEFSSKSIAFALSIVRNYLRYWIEKGRLPWFPLYLARIPPAISRSHNAITEDEYRSLLGALRTNGMRNLRDSVIIRMLHDTGMRVGELTSLEIDQIEIDASATIRTEKTVHRRQIFWNRDTDTLIHRLIVERVNSKSESDWLFVTSARDQERRIGNRMIQHIVRRACKNAGILRKISPHSFRHAYIHRLAALGTPDAIIAQLVGHSTPHTISHYTKLSRPEFEAAARKQFSFSEN